MKRVEAIRNHPLYQEYYEKLQTQELGRVFCKHDLEHFLDVARISYIQNLEQELGIHKEVVYGAALLHDIGKSIQYETQTPHEFASAQIAEQILSTLPAQVAFTEEEKKQILRAIWAHREEQEAMMPWERVFYKSDKLSRNCFLCQAEQECNWAIAKKNGEIVI